MVEEKQFKIRYLIATFIAFIIALIFYYGQSFEESIYIEGFPVPGNAQILNVSNQENIVDYEWLPASGENGLPLRYKLIIRLSGWEKVESLGTMTRYEKNGVNVTIVSLKNHIAIQTIN